MNTAQALLAHVRGFRVSRLTTTSTLWFPAGMIIVFNVLFAMLLLIRPGTHEQLVGVDDMAQTIGPFLMVPFCFWGAGKLWQQRRRTNYYIAFSIAELGKGLSRVTYRTNHPDISVCRVNTDTPKTSTSWTGYLTPTCPIKVFN